MTDKLTGSEAVFGFAAWLTCRPEAVTIGASNDCAIVAEMAGHWCDANDLSPPSDEYHTHLVHPAADPKRASEGEPE